MNDPTRAEPLASENSGLQTLSPKEYNAVVETANLADVVLVKSNFEVEPAYFDASSPKTFAYDLAEVNVSFESGGNDAQGAFTWAVKATAGDDETVLHISATFLAIYTNLDGQASEMVDAFVRRLGPFTTFPYFRSYVSQLSWLSKTELPILPVLRESSLKPIAAPSE